MTYKTRVPVNCFTCGAPMEVKMSRARRNKQFFCNRECRYLLPSTDTDGKVERIRLAIQEDQSKVIEHYTAMLNRIAGSHGLTQGEWDVQRVCRERFGLYDPDDSNQICFVTELFLVATTAKVAEKPVVPEPNHDEMLWGSYLSTWTRDKTTAAKVIKSARTKILSPQIQMADVVMPEAKLDPVIEDPKVDFWASFLDPAA